VGEQCGGLGLGRPCPQGQWVSKVGGAPNTAAISQLFFLKICILGNILV